jgi:hypothetical protein
MHKSIIGGVASLALLVTGLLSLDANATTLTGVAASHSSAYVSPVETVACWCGPLGGTTAALGGGRSYRCSCHRARALRGPPRMPCWEHATGFYCEVNLCRWDRWFSRCF